MLVSYVSSVVGSSDLDAIEAADELAVQPAFDAVCMAEPEQSVVACPDDRIDPRRRPVVGGLGAESDTVGEGGVRWEERRVGQGCVIRVERGGRRIFQINNKSMHI